MKSMITTAQLGYHLHKCELLLANTFSLYEREQAIFAVFLKRNDTDTFFRQVDSLAQEVISFTNLSETSDDYIHGDHELYIPLRAELHKSIADDWTEYRRWHEA